MAIKKSELYSSLWSSCDELRGGMDASQYKDYVLVLLFIKYISDKYAGMPYAPITIPSGASFKDMVSLKGKSDIGDQINKNIIAPLAKANQQLSQSDFPDFNDPTKLGDGKERVERLTNLIAIFENPSLNFSKNRAEGDDILGDAYEYLMRHFATESGKSKGQFYTPAEVSRVIAQILGIREAKTSAATSVYDPTCGSGSLLLKVGDEAGSGVTLYGQEKDAATTGLARMNMILHNYPTALILQGNTLADPKFKEGDALKTFDYVVANPPFSDKRWSTGVDAVHDTYDRFKSFGTPPAKQGDYAYLLHIIRSLKSTGRGACILPHGVLFRGNAEAEIRRNLVRKGYLKGIIGLPPNLFYGTGIPACIVVVDKKDAQARKGVFLIDASQGFIKDGPKNRLRAQDIHRIVDVFTRQAEVPRYSRMVPFEEIERNEFNLNLPRYIDSQTPEDRQDIEGHLKGGIPEADIEALDRYWTVCPALRTTLFKTNRPGYCDLTADEAEIRPAIFGHPEFAAYTRGMDDHFDAWRKKVAKSLRQLAAGFHPKELIASLSESLLDHYAGKALLDPYDVYQHLMDYWSETMQDDAYLVAVDGWKAETYRIIEKDKKGKEKDKGWACDLVPKPLIVARYFAAEQKAIDDLAAEMDGVSTELTELEEEHGGEEGAFASLDKVNKGNVTARLRELEGMYSTDDEDAEEARVLKHWLKLSAKEASLKKKLKEAEAELDAKCYAKYPTLSEAEVQTLVIDDKWLTDIDGRVRGELDRISQGLARRVKELAERYETPLPQLAERLAMLEEKVGRHIEQMILKLLDDKQDSSDVGEDWDTRRFAELFTTIRNASSSRSELSAEGDIAYVHYGDIHTHPNAFLDVRSKGTYIPRERVRSIPRLSDGDLLMADASEDTEAIGKAVEIVGLNGQEAVAGLHTIALRGKSELIVNGFKGYLQYMPQVRAALLRLATGVSVYGVTKTGVKAIEVTIPKPDEQAVISTVLRDVEAVIEALEKKLNKLRQIEQAMMHELLTGRVRLV